MPLLVDAATRAPMRLALRWVFFKRRYEVAESTIRSDLAALRQAYGWGEREFPAGLEGRLERGALTYDELQRLDAWLRHAHRRCPAASKGETSPSRRPASSRMWVDRHGRQAGVDDAALALYDANQTLSRLRAAVEHLRPLVHELNHRRGVFTSSRQEELPGAQLDLV
jgi:hypothetical protein